MWSIVSATKGYFVMILSNPSKKCIHSLPDSMLGFSIAAIQHRMSQHSTEHPGPGASVLPSNGSGPSNEILEECYFCLACLVHWGKSDSGHILLLQREISGCMHSGNTLGMWHWTFYSIINRKKAYYETLRETMKKKKTTYCHIHLIDLSKCERFVSSNRWN